MRLAPFALLIVVLCPLPVRAGTSFYAVVVGNNRSLDRALPELRYADDDAAKFYELFSSIGARTRLLVLLDAESQERFPELRARARLPRRAELEAALQETFEQIRQDNRRGQRTVFYFVFSGHGSVSATGQGQIHLFDSMFTRSDLFRQVVAASPATTNHLMIDACNAYDLVRDKGWRKDRSDEAYADLLRQFLHNEKLERYPNTGVLVATSGSTETHEWSRIESGLFSHQIRSGLAGAADVNGDGSVSYSEIAGYVSSANSRVPDVRARLNIFARPPAQNVDEPVLRRPARSLHRLRLARSLKGHLFLEDQRGIRYADFHKSDEAELSLLLAPQGREYYLRSLTGESRIALSALPRTVEVAGLEAREVRAKGALDEALKRGLYAEPFGPSYHAGFLAAWRRMLDDPLPPLAQRGRPARWRLGAAYLLTRPALDRGGLMHGVDLVAAIRLRSWLEGGLAASYGGSAEASWRQHRLSVRAEVSGTLALGRPWLRARASVGLGYLALFESGGTATRADPAAMTAQAEVGLEYRLLRALWIALRGGALLDLFRSDDVRQVRWAPLLQAGAHTVF
jgi:hypothetical protein